jgi:microcystin-dependent protein
MGTPYLAEIRIISFNFAPKGWALCNGQVLPINQNQALFSLLGTTYGGDGRTTFALPNLQGRIPFHVGNGLSLGQSSGEGSHTLNISELPAHTHVPVGTSNTADKGLPFGNLWASGVQDGYAANPNGSMNPASVLATGGSQPHQNMPPFLTLNFVIALAGIFPSPN